jgi:hypothetical protein
MSSGPEAPSGPSRFRVTLVRVLVIQAVTLACLWLLQSWYGR